MRKRIHVFVVFVSLALALGFPGGACGADKRNAAPAPMPVQITTAQKVFISNGGQDASFSAFSPRRAYDGFYAEIRAWGKATIVDTPSEADVVLEISLANELRLFGKELTSLPVLILTILDPKTHVRLWVCAQELESGSFVLVGAHQDGKFDKAMDRIVADFKSLVGDAPAAKKS